MAKRRILFFVLAVMVTLAAGCAVVLDTTPVVSAPPKEELPAVQPTRQPVAAEVPQITPVADPDTTPIPEGEERTILANVIAKDGRLYGDEVLWISGNDTETLLAYGIDPAFVANDYALVNEVEEYVELVLAVDATLAAIDYEKGIETIPMDFRTFYSLIEELSAYSGRLMDITFRGDVVIDMAEVYIP